MLISHRLLTGFTKLRYCISACGYPDAHPVLVRSIFSLIGACVLRNLLIDWMSINSLILEYYIVRNLNFNYLLS